MTVTARTWHDTYVFINGVPTIYSVYFFPCLVAIIIHYVNAIKASYSAEEIGLGEC